MKRNSSCLISVFALLILAAFVFSPGCALKTGGGGDVFVLEAGDLLLQDLDGSPFYEAIEKVTQGYEGANLSHAGIVARDGEGRVVVLEAVLEGVKAITLEEFLSRSSDSAGRPKVLVGRLKPEYRHLIQPAVNAAMSLVGKPYDEVFDLGNDAYYCSELVYYCFARANGGEPLFEPRPMTFVDPGTGEMFSVWRDYFAEVGTPIPEGEPGINPGGISRSEALSIIHAFGVPDGWRKTSR